MPGFVVSLRRRHHLPERAVEQALGRVVAQADQLVARLRIFGRKALQFAQALIVAPARPVGADEHLIGIQHQRLVDLALRDHLRGAIVAMHDLVALAHLHGELDDRIVARLPVDLGQQVVRLLIGEVAAARNRRQLAGIAEHQDRRAEAHQVLAERLVHHRAFVDDDQRRLGDRALPVDREHRRDRGLAGLLVLDRFLAARAVDQRMDGLGIAGARASAAPAPPCR